MEKEKIFRENLDEKRPPLYVYRAKCEDKVVFLNEIIPYITTDRKAILDFIETAKSFAKIECKDIALKTRGRR